MKIVQAANFVAPHSGGIRTTLRHLAAGYADAGHHVVQIVPGERDGVIHTPHARVHTVRAPQVPGTGYRVLTDLWHILSVLDHEQPDRLEVHDRATLRLLGRWARRHDVGSLVVSHERLDRLMSQWTPKRLQGILPLTAAADRSNTALAAVFDAVVATTAWAAAEFVRIGVTNLRQVPLGVDLARFHPGKADPSLRRAFARESELLLVHASRLSPEKRGSIAIDTLAELLRRGVPARLVIAGDGPSRSRYERLAADLPVVFLGFVADRDRLASLLATADVVLAPGPVETFGLAALEALASGTAIVVNHASALAELVVPGAGVAAAGCGWTFADAVQELTERPASDRADAARARAEQFPWSTTVTGFLDVHGIGGRPGPAGAGFRKAA
jgi:alpha-1,6-mannosyltransferase